MNTTLETTENAIKKFENIKESIKGIYDILKITAPSDNDIYFQLGVDNIKFRFLVQSACNFLIVS